MKLTDLQAQHAHPLEITHQSRWIDLLRDKSSEGARSWIPAADSANAPRTLVALTPEQLEAAQALVRKRYAWRGYQVSGAAAESQGAQPVTLITEANGELLGTLTVRPSAPLYAEETYGAEIRRLRSRGHRIGELVKLAVESGVDWKGALDALVQSAYFVSRVLHSLTDMVIEVNPRHVRFYERVFGFSVMASGGICSRVGAPSVLMHLDLATFGGRVRTSFSAH